MAGSAMAQHTAGDKFMPYPGSTYTYHLTNVQVGTAGGSFVISSNLQNVTVTAVTHDAGGYAFADVVNIPDGTSFTLDFTIAYDDAPLATGDYILVTVTDATSNCANYINLPIAIQPLPTFEIAIVGPVDDCQDLIATPNNEEAASLGATNTKVYTVTPTVTNVTTFAYTYTYVVDFTGTGLDAYDITINFDGEGSQTAVGNVYTVTGSLAAGELPTADTYTITYNTTTGVDLITIPGAVTGGNMNITSTNADYAADDVADDLPVPTMPAIGSFN
jgi:hypothetical protein